MTTEDQHIGFTIDPESAAKLKALSDADQRSLSAYIRIILKGHLEDMYPVDSE